LGREPFKARVRGIHAAFWEVDVAVEDLVPQGEKLAWCWRLRAMHVGTFMEIAPTKKRIALDGMNLQYVRDGRVVEHWTCIDLLDVIRQLKG
jgi:predicted ester cyclase